MKFMIKSSLFSALFMLIAFSSYAQQGRGPSMSPEERAKQQTAQMTEHLNLSDEQSKEVSKINQAYANKMSEARKEATDDRSAMRTKMESLMKEKSEALKEVLNEEQLKKLDEIQSKQEPRGRGSKGKGKARGAAQ